MLLSVHGVCGTSSRLRALSAEVPVAEVPVAEVPVRTLGLRGRDLGSELMA
ncbi:hypothetical protein ACFV0C_20965 [Streptomyces sp. NPDC059568]|uniref:hypothetical protein n=1 Tax=Streptomyces sp. NPDC059568 TaxID=3346868 RepID=UPI00367AFBA9